MTTTSEITRALADGGRNSDELLPLVYDELRRLAARYLRAEAGPQTLQPTALVHEAYLKLAGDRERTWESRAHFFGVAARAMRRLLIDRARRRGSIKRGSDRRRCPLDDVLDVAAARNEYLVSIDEALTALSELDPELGRVVELRFFGGLTVEQTAEVLGVGSATVKRMWRLAKGWLHRQIAEETP